MSYKYPNGNYITTSAVQDHISQVVYKMFSRSSMKVGMLTDFNQISGVAVYTYVLNGQSFFLYLDRNGVELLK